MFKKLLLLSILNLINCQSYMEMPDYGFPPMLPNNNPMNHLYRNKINNQFRRDSNEQQEMLKKFYQMNLLKNYQLNFTDWQSIVSSLCIFTYENFF